MINILILFISFFFSFWGEPATLPSEHAEEKATPAMEGIFSAQSILVEDLETGAPLLEQKSETECAIASLTKIMTIHLALKHLEPSERITVSVEAAATQGSAGDIQGGETFSVRDLISAAMMFSSNDAAQALAEATGAKLGANTYNDRISSFVEEMNLEASRLGMHKTRFLNPTGLDESPARPSNYASAQDLALLVRTTLENPLLWELSRESEKSIISTTGNTHRLLNINTLASAIPHFIGGKTGFTEIAGESLVLVYEYPLGKKQVAILLRAQPGKRFSEASRLLGTITTMFH